MRFKADIGESNIATYSRRKFQRLIDSLLLESGSFHMCLSCLIARHNGEDHVATFVRLPLFAGHRLSQVRLCYNGSGEAIDR
jgi:hypothetical protein